MSIARRLAALLAVIGLLFNQLAIAAHACPNLQGPDEAAAVSDLVATAGAAMGAVDPLTDRVDPNPCLQHCKNDKPAVDRYEVTSVASVVVLLYVLTPPSARAPRASHAPVMRDFLAHEIAPPLAIQYCSFLT